MFASIFLRYCLFADKTPAWTEKGIAGRGVLIDFESWAKKNAKSPEYFKGYGITIADVKTIVQEEKLELRPGDILFLRTGFSQAYGKLTAEGRTVLANGPPEWIGLAQGKETTEWLWENQFSAVAADAPGFECRREFYPRSYQAFSL